MVTADNIHTGPGSGSSRRHFDVQVSPGDDRVAVALHGECDVAAVPDVRAAYDEALDGPAQEVVVDLSGCTFVDSSCVGALLALHRRFGEQPGRTLVIVPGPPRVQRVFELCSVLDVLPFEGR